MKSETVRITITSTQKTDGTTSEPSVFSTRGQIREVNGRTHIFYEETDEEGRSTRTHLIPEKRRLEIRRSGGVETVLLYEPGSLTETVFRTPYGAIPLQVHTLEYRAPDPKTDSENEETEFSVRYEILQSSSVLSENVIHVRVGRRDDPCPD